ncbi:hypothetical protein [uncultured Enterovirga sp.]|uniref:hypothetical protein n=1 Tax=uncultured Enterovirga sp. TaxID=2026352 RepID=UPI0035CAA194
MNTEIRFLAQHLLHARTSPLSDRDRRLIQRVAHRVHVARDAEDRLAAAPDDEVNVKAEIAIADLHDQIDRLGSELGLTIRRSGQPEAGRTVLQAA